MNVTEKCLCIINYTFRAKRKRMQVYFKKMERINATNVVYAIQDGPCHISVYPIGATLQEWHDMGPNSVWSLAVQSACIEWEK